jgi:hypothetical protein
VTGESVERREIASAVRDGGPDCSVSTILTRSANGSLNVPVQRLPCQMLNTATELSAYQLSRIVLASPLTSKKTSPSRGRGTASGSDMLPIVTLAGEVV